MYLYSFLISSGFNNNLICKLYPKNVMFFKFYSFYFSRLYGFNYIFVTPEVKKTNKKNELVVGLVFLNSMLKYLKSVDFLINSYWVNRFDIQSYGVGATLFKERLLGSLLFNISLSLSFSNILRELEFEKNKNILEMGNKNFPNKIHSYLSLVGSELSKNLLRFRIIFWDLSNIKNLESSWSDGNFGMYRKLFFNSKNLISDTLLKSKYSRNVKITSTKKQNKNELSSVGAFNFEFVYKKNKKNNFIYILNNYPADFIFEKIKYDISGNSKLVKVFKRQEILSELVKLQGGVYDRKSALFLKNYTIAVSESLTEKLLENSKLVINAIRSCKHSEIIRISALRAVRKNKVAQLNSIKNLINDNNDTLYNSSYNHIFKAKLSYKKALLKKKFIELLDRISKIDKVLSVRYNELVRVRSTELLFRMWLIQYLVNGT